MSTNIAPLKWYEQFVESLKNILQRMSNLFPMIKRIQELEEEGSLYDENGDKTDEFDSALKSLHSSIENNTSEKPFDEQSDTPELVETISTAFSMIEERQQLMKDYDKEKRASEDEEEDFDALKWMEKRIPDDEALTTAKQRFKEDIDSEINSVIKSYGKDKQN